MKLFIYILFLAILVIVATLYRKTTMINEGFDVNFTIGTTTTPSTSSQQPETISGTSLQSLLNNVSSQGSMSTNTQSSNNPLFVVDPQAALNWNPTIPRVNSTPAPTQPVYTLPNVPGVTCPTCQPNQTPVVTQQPTSGCPYSTPPNFTSTLPKGVTLDQIPDCFKDKYILKTEIVPPVCPACPACNAYPAPTTPIATTPQATCSCSHSTPIQTPMSTPTTSSSIKINPSLSIDPSIKTSPNPSISNIALNANPNPNLQGMNTSQDQDPGTQSKMNSNYGTSFDNYPFQTPMQQTQYTMPPLNPFVYNNSRQGQSPWPMPILNDFSKFGS
jgi:hypothetical protein